MLNRSASLAVSKSFLEALPGKVDIKRHSPSLVFSIYIFICNSVKSELFLLYNYNEMHQYAITFTRF